MFGAGCDGRADPSPSPTSAARDYCSEHGFVDGEQRNAAGELVAECETGRTPNGGAYSIAHYSGNAVEITEYDDDGNIVQRTYGTRGDD